ncbi:phosphatase PAP2 family protein [Halorussus litoreus]|uniref:phosphatase PAP2 family protein n=1 Tax=Halorussus litoreus TaxID=1710536 RepID=UPI001E2ECA02|nr:phosphatase PAP2 family protein [Halorussus litoreus]
MLTNAALRAGRGVGVTELLTNHGEWLLVVLFGLVTQLGDVWFLFVLGGVLYVGGEFVPRWGVSRRQGLFVLSLVLTYVALIGVLKHVFLLPRPSGAGQAPALEAVPRALAALLENATTAEGPGFPSGHALGTTMVWGGFALVLDRGTARARFGVAAAVVALVSLSRLVLGVHYAVDVIVGAALGAVTLLALYRFSDGATDPGRVLGVAVAVGLLGLLVSLSFDSVAAIGGALGGWLAWRTVGDGIPAQPSSHREVALGLAIFGAAGALFAVVYAVEPSYPATFLGTALTGAGVVAAPSLGERLG